MKIPKQIYVTSKLVTEYEWLYDKTTKEFSKSEENSYSFGFLHPHEPNTKADEKRKDTQHVWAYRCSYDFYKEGGILKNRVWKNSYDFCDTSIDEFNHPKIFDNTPMSGFEIIDTVNRYRGNKLFKVKDPRGYVFEVTVASLFEIISNGIIENGVIKNPCIWKSNKNLIIA